MAQLDPRAMTGSGENEPSLFPWFLKPSIPFHPGPLLARKTTVNKGQSLDRCGPKGPWESYSDAAFSRLSCDPRESQWDNCSSAGSGANRACALTCVGAVGGHTGQCTTHWVPRGPATLLPFPISHRPWVALRPNPSTETTALPKPTSQVSEQSKEWPPARSLHWNRHLEAKALSPEL